MITVNSDYIFYVNIMIITFLIENKSKIAVGDHYQEKTSSMISNSMSFFLLSICIRDFFKAFISNKNLFYFGSHFANVKLRSLSIEYQETLAFQNIFFNVYIAKSDLLQTFLLL